MKQPKAPRRRARSARKGAPNLQLCRSSPDAALCHKAMTHRTPLLGLGAAVLLLVLPSAPAVSPAQASAGPSGAGATGAAGCFQGVVKERRFGRLMGPAQTPFFQTAVAVPTRETIVTLFNGVTLTALQEANDTTFFDNFQLGHRLSVCRENKVAACADGRRAPALLSVYDEVSHSRALGYVGSDACGQG